MFNKEESNIVKKIEIKKTYNLKKNGHFMITPTLIITIAKEDKIDNTFLQAHFKYEKSMIKYINRVNDYGKTKTYDKNIVTLYNNGTITIDKEKHPLEKYYITYTNGSFDDFHLICIGNNETDILLGKNEDYPFNNAVKLMDTTAFIELIKSDCVNIVNTDIEIKNKEKAKKIIDKWDGFLHDKVKETDAIENKDRLGK